MKGLTVQQAAEYCSVGESRISSLCRRGLLPAHKDGPRGNSPWLITAPPSHIVKTVEHYYPTARVVVIPKISFRLSDEDCWASHGSFMAEGGTGANGYTVVDDEYRCPHCQRVDHLEWNGRNYYCECRPLTPVYPDAVSKRVELHRFPYPATTTPVQSSVDESYALETQYIRVPAASNWPRGRNDPHINRINEEAPRANLGFSRARSRR
jgi:hypothetical protein